MQRVRKRPMNTFESLFCLYSNASAKIPTKRSLFASAIFLRFFGTFIDFWIITLLLGSKIDCCWLPWNCSIAPKGCLQFERLSLLYIICKLSMTLNIIYELWSHKLYSVKSKKIPTNRISSDTGKTEFKVSLYFCRNRTNLYFGKFLMVIFQK